MSPSQPSQLYCIDCDKATPIINPGSRPANCIHCGSAFPPPNAVGTEIRNIPASGMETAAHEPDLDPDKFWEIPAAFKSREEADAHHSRIFRRKVGSAILLIILGIGASYYFYINAPPYKMSNQVEAAVSPSSPEAQNYKRAIETAVEVVESTDWSELKKFVSPTSATPARMARYYKTSTFQQQDVRSIESITGDLTTKTYDVFLTFKNAPNRNITIDLSENTPQIDWEMFSGYYDWVWQQFKNGKNNNATEVHVFVKQIPPSTTAIDEIGIEIENAIGLALWHDNSDRPLYSAIDKTTATGQAILEATNSETGTKLTLNIASAPDPAPSFLVIVHELIEKGW